MKLQYRGIPYESNAHTMTSVDSGITAKFRGFIYHIQRPLKTYLHSAYVLKYRGISYIKGNYRISPSTYKIDKQKNINSTFNNYSIYEDYQRFIRDFNRFNS